MLQKNLLLIIIITIAAFLRFYQLGTNPPSLDWDEVSNGYNAYSILKTARDEYGTFLPPTFKAFGDYNPALSVYLLVPSIAIFGLNEFAVRFPSALFGTLTVLLTYFLAKKLFADSKPKFEIGIIGNYLPFRRKTIQFDIPTIASLLLAISPWHLQFSRYDHEANFMVFFAILGLVLLLYSKNDILPDLGGSRFSRSDSDDVSSSASSLRRGKHRGIHGFKNKYWFLVLSSIAFGLAINTYHGAKLWIPLFLIAIIFWFRKEIFNLGSRLLAPVLILMISLVPMFINLTNTFVRSSSVGIFSRSDTFSTFISGYLSHFSPNFLFIQGDSIGRHSVPGMGMLYVFELPLIILGLITLIKKGSTSSKFLLTWLVLAPIPAALATPTPHALRAITFLPVWSIIAAFGIKTILNVSLSKKIKLAIIVGLISIAVYNVVTYLHLYYKHYPKQKAADWQDGYSQMVQFVDKIKDQYSVIAMTNYYGRPYIFVLFWSQYDPHLYQTQSKDKNKFDKFEFFGESWEKKTQGKALLVRPAWQIPNPAPHYIKFIHDKSGDLIFRISEE